MRNTFNFNDLNWRSTLVLVLGVVVVAAIAAGTAMTSSGMLIVLPAYIAQTQPQRDGSNDLN